MNTREIQFRETLEVSDRTRIDYIRAINSKFMKEELMKHFGLSSLFEISDVKALWEFYTQLNLHPKNIKNHRGYSAPIRKYISFLNHGKKYGRKTDLNKSRNNKRRRQSK